jgi:RNA polymerase sigma factor (TIGR02999 family)
MRQIIVDFARRRNAQRRGAGVHHLNVDDREIAIQAQAEQLLILNELLEGLEDVDSRLLQVVECRYFAGYSESETAEALGVSTRTVERDWLRAKAWLRAAMDGKTAAADQPLDARRQPGPARTTTARRSQAAAKGRSASQ